MRIYKYTFYLLILIFLACEDKDGNYRLSEIKIKEINDFEFSPEDLWYALKVESLIDSVTIEVLTENSSSSYIVSAIGNDGADLVARKNIFYLKHGENVINIDVYAEDGTSQRYVIKIRRYPCHITSLINFTLDGINTIPEFNSDSLDYYTEVSDSVSDIRLNIVKGSKYSDLIVYYTNSEGNQFSVKDGFISDLSSGVNIVFAEITSEDDLLTRMYKIVIKKHSSSDSRLKELRLDGFDFTTKFHPETYNYVTNVPNSVYNIRVVPVPENPEVTCEIQMTNRKGDSFNIETDGTVNNLLSGENMIKITVKSKDLTSKTTYIVNVDKKLSSNNNLAFLKVKGFIISPEFSPDNLKYDVSIGADNSVEIDYEREDEESDISLSGYDTNNLSLTRNGKVFSGLKVGVNKLYITVDAEIGLKKKYIINVNKIE